MHTGATPACWQHQSATDRTLTCSLECTLRQHNRSCTLGGNIATHKAVRNQIAAAAAAVAHEHHPRSAHAPLVVNSPDQRGKLHLSHAPHHLIKVDSPPNNELPVVLLSCHPHACPSPSQHPQATARRSQHAPHLRQSSRQPHQQLPRWLRQLNVASFQTLALL